MVPLASPNAAISGLAAVRAEIARACREAGRDVSAVELVAVSKTFGPSKSSR